MKKTLLFIAALFIFEAGARNLKPVSDNIGKLNISVDPRMEVLGVIQVLSDYPFVVRSSSYAQNIQEYFKDFTALPAIKLTNNFYDNGFSYDAPPTFMLHLEQPLSLKERVGYSDYLINRADGRDKLERYRLAIHDFVNESGFEKFWNSNKAFYKEMVRQTKNNVGEIDLVKALEEYYNESQNTYNIILCPSSKNHNYGPRILNDNARYDIYSCNSLPQNKEGVPELSGDQLLNLVWHEFGHSFVNPLSAVHLELVMSYRHLFEPIGGIMGKQAYNNWETCVNEHIVRAVVIRLFEKYIGKEAADRLIDSELSNKFVYIRFLVDKLREYESKRDSENITFAGFYPELLNTFEGLEEKIDLRFRGPINNVFGKENKLAIIYPTAGSDTAGLTKLRKYVKVMADFINDRLKMKEVKVISDSWALNTSLADYNIIVYGTMESNSFLTSLQPSLPFKIKDGKIYADKEYASENIKFVTCLLNPYNSEKGLLIYTALNNENILNINNVYHGNEDYILFSDRENIIHRGYYNKEDIWKY